MRTGLKVLAAVLMLALVVGIGMTVVKESKAQSQLGQVWSVLARRAAFQDSMTTAGILRIGAYDTLSVDVTGVNTTVNVATKRNIIKILNAGAITRITGVNPGTMYWLYLSGLDTLTDGVNLKMAGSLNGTADDVIGFVAIDTNLVEISRSVN